MLAENDKGLLRGGAAFFGCLQQVVKLCEVNMDYPKKIYAIKKIGTNGIECLDYRNFNNDVEYIRADLAMTFEELKDAILQYKAKSEYRQTSIVMLRNIFEGHVEKTKNRI